VIARSGLKLRGGPGTNFDSETMLPAGTELNVVQVSSVNPAWARVNLEGDDLLDGYVFAAFLAPVGASGRKTRPRPTVTQLNRMGEAFRAAFIRR
jgi:hypothetical protein